MNTRIIITTFVLAVSAFTGARAQTELPHQWVDQQMKAAPQAQAAQARATPAATSTVVAAAAPALSAAAPAGQASVNKIQTAAKK